MILNHSALLVYGVIILGSEAVEFKKNNKEDYDRWIIAPDLWWTNSDKLAIGYYYRIAEEGNVVPVNSLQEPDEEKKKRLVEVLDYLGITTKPGWLLMSQVS